MTRQATPRSGFTRVTLPGEIEWELTQERLANGIPLHKQPLQEIEQLADELGVEIPLEQVINFLLATPPYIRV